MKTHSDPMLPPEDIEEPPRLEDGEPDEWLESDLPQFYDGG